MLDKILDLDRRWTHCLRIAENPGRLRTAAALLAHSGDSWFWGLLLLPLALAAPPETARRASLYLVAILITAVLVFSIKLVVRRQRPTGEWGQIYRKTDPHSFPSGHAARAVLLAVLGLALGPTWLGAILALWAPLVAVARVAMGVHYLLDVAAGALVGVAIAVILLLVI